MSHAIEVARHKDTVYARVVGLGNFNNAGPFREFVDAMIQTGVRTVVVDFAQCQGLDSTFMGTLIGFMTCPLRQGEDTQELHESAVQVMVVNQTPATRKAMDSLGLAALLKIKNEPVAAPGIPLQRLREDWLDEKKRVRLIQQAHEHLVKVDKANEEKFGPFLKMLLKETPQGPQTGA